MKKYFIFIICITILFSCQKSKNIKAFNKELVNVVKEHSYYSQLINWELVEKDIDSISSKFQNIDQCSLVTKHIIIKLRDAGDFHTIYVSKNKVNQLTQNNIVGIQPESKYLGERIGYINVPGFASVNAKVSKRFSTQIQNLIKCLEEKYHVNAWIVDLRSNTGGNMHPMIHGLSPLLGKSVYGYFIDRNSKKEPWTFDNCKIKETKVDKPYELKNRNAKIAVLISNRTGSSGEMTAISFIGKQNTKLFGQNTAGYTTANTCFMLPDKSFIALATSISADRNMKVYHESISPDVYVGSLMSDECIEDAIKWLKEK